MDGRRQAHDRVFEVRGTGQRVEVVVQRRLQLDHLASRFHDLVHDLALTNHLFLLALQQPSALRKSRLPLFPATADLFVGLFAELCQPLRVTGQRAFQRCCERGLHLVTRRFQHVPPLNVRSFDRTLPQIGLLLSQELRRLGDGDRHPIDCNEVRIRAKAALVKSIEQLLRGKILDST